MSETTDVDFETIADVAEYLHEHTDKVAVIASDLRVAFMLSVDDEIVGVETVLGQTVDVSLMKQDDTELGEDRLESLSIEDAEYCFTDPDEMRDELSNLLDEHDELAEDADLIEEAVE